MERSINSGCIRNDSVGMMTPEGVGPVTGSMLFSRSGASLIEITLTVFILALTALVITTFSRNTMTMSVDARSMDAAHLAGEQKIIELSAKTFPDSTGKDTTYVDSVRCIRSWSIPNSGYIKCGIVTVEWKALKGTRKITVAGAIP
jgi:hypothetical protein